MLAAVCGSARGGGATAPIAELPTVSEPSATLHRDYEGEAVTLRTARRDVIAWLSDLGADEATKERAALIVSELATNALQASPGRTYTVHVARDDDEYASISVRNHASGGRPPSRDRWHFADRSSLRGRGLAIVTSLAEEVTVNDDEGEGEVVVTARIRLPLP
jgi:anti-sigma regulatory factor (Ser/Thr protein kinase)